jgi:glycerol-3-phosphate dehydrogenase
MTKLIRDVQQMANQKFDLLVVGGGIFGVCAAWEAALRGLKVAIVEKQDFSHATSANHFKMIHGGIRYLQHGDIVRLRASSRERSALLRITPHMSKPLPIIIPTYGWGIKGKAFLGPGVALYDLLTWDRNKGLKNECKIPGGRFLSKKQVIKLFPQLNRNQLTGGALIYDGQLYNPPRLAISFLRSAVSKGALSANYLEVNGFLKKQDRIVGVNAKDLLSGREIKIQAQMVLNAAGPWAHRLLSDHLGISLEPKPTFSRDLALVVKRKPKHDFALAFATQSKDTDSIIDRGGRHLFAVPWRNFTLVGVWHKVFKGLPENISVTLDEVKQYLSEVNVAFEGSEIRPEEVGIVNMGLTLFGDEEQQQAGLSFGKRSSIIDHDREHGLKGLITLIGVRATMARGMAEAALVHIMARMGHKPTGDNSALMSLYGGDYSSFENLLSNARNQVGLNMSEAPLEAMLHNYGARYLHVIKYAQADKQLWELIGDSNVSKAEIVHAIREEMAETLADVVLRRTDLGTGSKPENGVLADCAALMAAEKGWDEKRCEAEIKAVKAKFPNFINS